MALSSLPRAVRLRAARLRIRGAHLARAHRGMDMEHLLPQRGMRARCAPPHVLGSGHGVCPRSALAIQLLLLPVELDPLPRLRYLLVYRHHSQGASAAPVPAACR